jgi:excisionase family DNA binding protein
MKTPARVNGNVAREYLGCSRETLKRLRRDHAIRFYRLGHRSIAYDVASLDAYLNKVCVEQIGG